MLFYVILGARAPKESFAQMTRALVLLILSAYPTHAALGTLKPWNLFTAQRIYYIKYAGACALARVSEEV